MYDLKPGARDFLVRCGAFLGIAMGLYLFVFLYFRHTLFFQTYLSLPEDFYFAWLSGLSKTDVMNAVLFTAVIFIVWNRKTLFQVETYKQPWITSISLFVVALLVQVAHYWFKYAVSTNLDWAYEHELIVTLGKYIFNIVFIIVLAIAVFGWSFLVEQAKKYRYQIPLFTGVGLVFFFLIKLFQSIWLVFGNFAAWNVAWLMRASFIPDVFVRFRDDYAPTLGGADFIVRISDACSGIDSLLLFIALMSTLLVLDWHRLRKGRMAVLFVIGVIGALAYNVLRIYSLMLVGIFYSPEFAVDVFHTNVGWIFFLIFFIILWHFGSKWVYIRK